MSFSNFSLEESKQQMNPEVNDINGRTALVLEIGGLPVGTNFREVVNLFAFCPGFVRVLSLMPNNMRQTLAASVLVQDQSSAANIHAVLHGRAFDCTESPPVHFITVAYALFTPEIALSFPQHPMMLSSHNEDAPNFSFQQPSSLDSSIGGCAPQGFANLEGPVLMPHLGMSAQIMPGVDNNKRARGRRARDPSEYAPCDTVFVHGIAGMHKRDALLDLVQTHVPGQLIADKFQLDRKQAAIAFLQFTSIDVAGQVINIMKQYGLHCAFSRNPLNCLDK